MSTSESRAAISRLLANERITLVEGDYPTAAFDIVNRVLLLPTWVVTDNQYQLMISHEVGHALWTPADFTADHNTKIRGILNVVEDARIERMIQSKYPGLIRIYKAGYAEFLDADFFKIRGHDVAKFNIIDRINLKAKLGDLIDIDFTACEQTLFDRVMTSETWEDVCQISQDIYAYAKLEAKQNKKQEDKPQQPSCDLPNPDGAEYESDESQNDNGFSQPPIDLSDEDDNSESEGQKKKSSEEADDESEEADEEVSGEGNEKTDDEAAAKTADPDSDESDEDEEDVGNADKSTDDEEAIDESKDTSDDLDESIFESQTQRNISDRLSDTVKRNDSLTTIYVDDVTKEIVVGYKELAAIRKKAFSGAGRNFMAEESFQNSYRAFRADMTANVGILRKEFDLRKSAYQYSRARVSKTGTLDLSKVHSYRYNEDIFLSVTELANAKQHGLIMFVDNSGSMRYSLDAILKQIITLCEFCRKVKIPYAVYSFTTPKSRQNNLKTMPYNTFGMRNLAILEWASSKMTTVEHNEAMAYLYNYSEFYTGVPPIEQMASTPLVETTALAHYICRAFKNEHKVQKLTVAFLTDGIENVVTTTNSTVFGGQCYPVFTQNIEVKIGQSRATGRQQSHVSDLLATDSKALVASLRTSLKALVGCNFVGYFVINNPGKFGRNMWKNAKTRIVSDGIAIFDDVHGYDRYFLVNQNLAFPKVKIAGPRPADHEMTRGQVAREFAKQIDVKRMQRTFAQQFCEIFS
jgi:hypothetical protein